MINDISFAFQVRECEEAIEPLVSNDNIYVNISANSRLPDTGNAVTVSRELFELGNEDDAWCFSNMQLKMTVSQVVPYVQFRFNSTYLIVGVSISGYQNMTRGNVTSLIVLQGAAQASALTNNIVS